MTRYVFDTNQIIAAGTAWLADENAPNLSPARRLLTHVANNETGIYCKEMMREYVEKLVERRHPADRVGLFVQYILGAFEQITIVTANAPHCPVDPDDEIFVLCAIDGNAHYLITDDGAILALIPHYNQFVICGAHAELARLGL